MNCDIVLVGLNHRTAAVDIRERFALVKHTDPDTWALPLGGAIQEALILSTCNRVELLAMGKGDIAGQMLRCWSQARGAKTEDLAPYIYSYTNADAVRHLFSVASSLDSMVLGEPQILGQLKQAYRKASACHATGVILNHLLHKAFSVAKRVRTETAVASSAVSISYAAVELAKRIFGSMQGHKAMLIGAGEMAELAATHLMQNGIDEIYVANRTLAHAEKLASFYHGRAVPFTELTRHLIDVDIIITSTGSQDPILHARDIRAVLRERRNRPMFFIDIAVPRDIDPDVNGLDNVYLYDIDDLKEVVEENLAGRREEAVKAENIVAEEVQNFKTWLGDLDVQPTIKELVHRSNLAADEEVARTLHRLGRSDQATKDALDAMAQALIKKFFHNPFTYLKEGDRAEHSRRIITIQQVFNLDHHCACRFNDHEKEDKRQDGAGESSSQIDCPEQEAASDKDTQSAGLTSCSCTSQSPAKQGSPAQGSDTEGKAADKVQLTPGMPHCAGQEA